LLGGEFTLTTQQFRADAPLPMWRRIVRWLLTMGLTIGLLGGLQFSCLSRLMSSGTLRGAADALASELEALPEGASLFGEPSLGGLLGDEGQAEVLGRDQGRAVGVIRGLKRVPESANKAMKSSQQMFSGLALAWLLVALASAGGLLLFGGPGAWSEGLGLATLVVGIMCVMLGVGASAMASRMPHDMGEVVLGLGQGLLREFMRFQLQAGVPCLIAGTGMLLGLSWVEKSATSVTLRRQPPR